MRTYQEKLRRMVTLDSFLIRWHCKGSFVLCSETGLASCVTGNISSFVLAQMRFVVGQGCYSRWCWHPIKRFASHLYFPALTHFLVWQVWSSWLCGVEPCEVGPKFPWGWLLQKGVRLAVMAPNISAVLHSAWCIWGRTMLLPMVTVGSF